MLILGRRAFIGHAAALAASAAGVWSLAHQTAATRLVVTHVHPAEEIMDEVLWGIRLGVEEAQHSAAMFGGSVELRDLQLPMGVAPAAVKVNTQMAGGGFGRRAIATSDYVVEACQVAKAARAAGLTSPVRRATCEMGS